MNGIYVAAQLMIPHGQRAAKKLRNRINDEQNDERMEAQERKIFSMQWQCHLMSQQCAMYSRFRQWNVLLYFNDRRQIEDCCFFSMYQTTVHSMRNQNYLPISHNVNDYNMLFEKKTLCSVLSVVKLSFTSFDLIVVGHKISLKCKNIIASSQLTAFRGIFRLFSKTLAKTQHFQLLDRRQFVVISRFSFLSSSSISFFLVACCFFLTFWIFISFFRFSLSLLPRTEFLIVHDRYRRFLKHVIKLNSFILRLTEWELTVAYFLFYVVLQKKNARKNDEEGKKIEKKWRIVMSLIVVHRHRHNV